MTQGYLFANRVLPQLAFSDPVQARKLFAEAASLKRLWVHTGLHAQHGNPRPPDGLGASHEGDWTLITLPTPGEAPEAHFLAICWNAPTPLYYTLELGEFDGESSNFLCGWTPTGHVNYGDGHPADPIAFMKACRGLAGF